MRIARLISLALQAEGIRLQRVVQRAAIRGTLAAAALLFVAASLALLDLAAVSWLVRRNPLPLAAAIVGGVNLLVAALLLVAASRRPSRRSDAELAALRARIRTELLASVGRTAMLTEFLVQLMRSLRNR
jgi:hypothetical protein